jgi:amidase
VAGSALPAWRNAFRLIQSSEAWACHGAWVRQTRPNFGPGVRERFAAAGVLDPVEVDDAKALRATIRGRMDELLGDDAVLIAPTAPGIAPMRNMPSAPLEAFRARALELLCPAGHAGLPQISLPLASIEGCPLGLSVVAPRGQDEVLMGLAKRLCAAPR